MAEDLKEPHWYTTSLRRSGVSMPIGVRRRRMDRKRVMTAEYEDKKLGLIYRHSGAAIEAWSPFVAEIERAKFYEDRRWLTTAEPEASRRQFETIRQAQVWLWQTFQEWLVADAMRRLSDPWEARGMGVELSSAAHASPSSFTSFTVAGGTSMLQWKNAWVVPLPGKKTP